MKNTTPTHTTRFIQLFIVILFISTALRCKKTTVIEHPFTDIETLDCRNLLIRSVELKGAIVEVAIENTCKNCEDDFVYLGVLITKRGAPADTIARTPCLTCYSCPKNGEVKKYELVTNRTSLPDIKTLKIDFEYLCTDVTYLPK
jgi:hypothetical protein